MSERIVDKPEAPDIELYPKGQYLEGKVSIAKPEPVNEDPFPEETNDLMAGVLARANMLQAYHRVCSNKGAPGVDGVTVDALKAQLQSDWLRIKAELQAGCYQPAPIRAVDIPKPDGGVRTLGIPTVIDRLIQQAILQILTPLYEPRFSDASYGYRPGRSAGQAVEQMRKHVEDGYTWVVDLDLERFFDRVNHDILMSRLARTVRDKALLRVIRRYLEAGMMTGGLVSARVEGMPQGGPLSPLLSNILLDEFDKELEQRGHRFCRYADDVNVYVKSRRSGERVLASVTQFLDKRLRLKVNATKSGVTRPAKTAFLGYSVQSDRRGVRLKVAAKSLSRLRSKLKVAFRRGRGRNIRAFIKELAPLLRGWANYYRYATVLSPLQTMDGWIRRHLRKILWRQWKRPLARARMLMQLGLDSVRAWKSATNGRGPWWNAGATHMNTALTKRHFEGVGLISLVDQVRKLTSTT